MACEFVCDVCGNREPGVNCLDGSYVMPTTWWHYSDSDKIYDVCCLVCSIELYKKVYVVSEHVH